MTTIKISTIIIILMPPHLACYHHHHYHHRKNRHRHHRCGHTDSKCSIISIFNPKQQKQNPQHLCTSSIVLLAQFLDISPGLHKRLHCHSISIFRCRVQRAVSAAHPASRRAAIDRASPYHLSFAAARLAPASITNCKRARVKPTALHHCSARMSLPAGRPGPSRRLQRRISAAHHRPPPSTHRASPSTPCTAGSS